MLTRILDRVEGVTAPFSRWCAAFIGILFVRFFIENISGPITSFPGTPDAATLVHYFLFFMGAFFSLALMLRIFVPDITRISKFLLFGLPIIWLAPILDLIYSHGVGSVMAYAFVGNVGDIARAFFSFGHFMVPGQLGSITPGLRVELGAIAIGAALYVVVKTKNIAKAILAGVASYLVLFSWLISPGIIAIVAGGHMLTQASVVPSLISSFANSHIMENFLRPTVGLSYLHATDTVFNLGISIVFYLVDFVLIALWAALRAPKTIKAFIKNIRPGRLAYYVGMLGMGMLGAIRTEPVRGLENWVDVALFACLVISYFSAFMLAIGVNDLADIKTDSISSKGRPLPSGTMTESDFANTNLFFLVWLLLGGFICGYWALFTVIVFTAAYYIYSAPPLRLKRIPLVASFLISLATLSALMAGFYFADMNKFVSDFPMPFILLIVVCITLAINFKDIKDVHGDRADGVWTIPVVFGEEHGKQIVGAMLAMAFLAVPTILRYPALFLPSLAAGILGYLFVIEKNYREWKIFALYFAYAGVAGALLWITPWISSGTIH